MRILKDFISLKKWIPGQARNDTARPRIPDQARNDMARPKIPGRAWNDTVRAGIPDQVRNDAACAWVQNQVQNDTFLEWIDTAKAMAFVAFAVLFFVAGAMAQITDKRWDDMAVSNGGTMSQNDKYQHITSVNSGIVFPDTLETLDFRIDTGILAMGNVPSDNIKFSNPSVSVFQGAPISIDVESLGADLRQVKVRYSLDTVPGDTQDYNLAWSSGMPGGSNVSSGTFSYDPGFTTTTKYYVQWYAQNIDKEWNTFTYAVEVTTGLSAKFTKPLDGDRGVSTQPEIEIEIKSNYGFKLSNVNVVLYDPLGKPSNPYISTDDTVYSEKTIKFKYSGPPLIRNAIYGLSVDVLDEEGKRNYNEVWFRTVLKEGLYRFVPYPSSYNPNSGKPFQIKYSIGEDSEVSVNVYDRSGKLVCRVVPSLKQIAGEYTVDWYAKNYAGDTLANGVYICEIKVKGVKEERRYISFAILRK